MSLIPTVKMNEATIKEQVQKLFARRRKIVWDTNDIEASDIPLLKREELEFSVSQPKTKKAPGPDGIPPEVRKMFAQVNSTLILNDCLARGWFPETWKRAKRILIEKPRKADAEMFL